MTFTFHHSLVSRAAVSVVVSLWYHEDIDSLKRIDGLEENGYLYEMCKFDEAMFSHSYKKRIRRLVLHKKVTESVLKLFIPENLKRYLLEFVQIIGENLEDWLQDQYSTPTKREMELCGYFFQARSFDITTFNGRDMNNITASLYRESNEKLAIDVDLRKVLRWTPDGEIDLEQTGEALVRNESDLTKRFKLACSYCRADEMVRLWPCVQDHFSSPEVWDSNSAHLGTRLFWRRYFTEFWPESVSTYLLEFREIESFKSAIHFSRTFSFTNNCSPLTIYLLKRKPELHLRISHEMKLSYRVWCRKQDFRLFFSNMPESVFVRILRDYPEKVLAQFLLWRHHSFFVDTVERNWNIFDEYLFESILYQIVFGVLKYEDSDIYRRIFHWYWTTSPAHLRDVEFILYDLEVAGSRTLRHFVDVLFGHSPAAVDKMKRILFEGRYVLELLMYVRSRDVLSCLIRACLPSEEWDEKLELLNEYFAENIDGQ